MEKRIQVCIISLIDDLDRRAHASLEMKKTRFSWEFIDAVKGKSLNTVPQYDAKKGRRLVGFELTHGEIGCFLSHRLVWQRCVDAQMNTLVLEDDFVMLPHAEEAIKTALNHENLWEILRLQAMVEVQCKKKASCEGFDFYENLADPLGTTAYVIKPSSAQALLKMSERFIEPVDHFVENYRKHRIPVTAIKPYPIDIMHAQSTIDEPSENRNNRKPIRGWAKAKRSIYRNIYRLLTWKSVP